MISSNQTRILTFILSILIVWLGFANLSSTTGYTATVRPYPTGPVASVLYIGLGVFAILNAIKNKADDDKS